MTRLKTIALSLLGWFVLLAALGLLASVGLVVLGALALLGLALAVAAWVNSAIEPTRPAVKTSA